MYYSINVRKGKWTQHHSTRDYTEFFDEAVKIINDEFPDSLSPAFMTVLPAFEAGDLGHLEIDHIAFDAWEIDDDEK